MQPQLWVPYGLARHGAAVTTTLFLCFLAAFMLLRAKERRGMEMPPPRWKGPLSLAWATTVLCAAMMLTSTFAGIQLQRPFTIDEIDELEEGAEFARHSLGRGLLRTSVLVFPGVTVCSWIGLYQLSRRQKPISVRHSFWAFLGLALSTAGMLVYWLVYGLALWK